MKIQTTNDNVLQVGETSVEYQLLIILKNGDVVSIHTADPKIAAFVKEGNEQTARLGDKNES